VKAVFFDLDGTLTDINQREIEVISDTLSHFGRNVSKSRVRKLVAQTPSYMDAIKELGFVLNETSLRYWTEAFVKNYHFSKVRRGVKSTLRALRKNQILFCVTSRETLAEVREELEFFRLDGFFSYIVTRDVATKHFGLETIPFFPFHEQRRKLYECALALAECRPSDVVAIGDMGRELEPARELGITTIGLITYRTRMNALQKASDYLISRVNQVQKVIQEVNGS